MKKDTFLQEIEKDLGKSAEAARFREEIRDHVDDSLSDLSLKQTEDDVTRTLGDPKKLTRIFNGYMLKRLLVWAFFQSLYTAILSTPLYTIILWSLTSIVDSWQYANASLLLRNLGFILVSLALLWIVYRKTVPDIFLALAGWKRHLFWMLIIFSPLLLIILGASEFAGRSSPMPHAMIIAGVGGEFSLLGFGVISFVSSVRHLRKKAIQIHQHKKKSRSTALFAFLLLIYIAFSQLFAYRVVLFDTLPFHTFYESFPQELWFIFFPRGLLENIVLNFIIAGMILAPLTFFPPFGVFWPYWVLGSALVFVGCVLVVQTVQHFRKSRFHDFPWLRCVGFVYIILLFVSPVRTPDLSTPLPMTNVSAIIEKQQLGPFTNLMRYLNQSEGPYAQYEVYGGSSFLIRPNRGMIAWRIADIRSADSFEVVRAPEETSHLRAEDQEYINRREEEFNGIACTYSHDDPAKEEKLRRDTLCNTLLYHGKPFFRNNSPWFGWLDGLILSDDGKWAMIRISTGAYDAENVYLVDLRTLASTN
ncbi:MAG: hypothetical protein HYV34_01330 [Candidatus Kerfeldbacteria bacterium]|nr:hypothetical protein [Candidatus Kerfeldbacteria bacterium]